MMEKMMPFISLGSVIRATITMKFLVVLASFVVITTAVISNEDGRYYHDDSGAYIPDNSGQYIPDGSGRYFDDGAGRYADDGTGRYRGQIEKYLHQKPDKLIGSAAHNQHVRSSNVPVKRTQPIITPQYNQNNYQNGKWKIIRQVGDIGSDGYHWEYETENKIIAEESGKLHNIGTDNEIIRAKGFFEYIGPDNVAYKIHYTADENGFVPTGKHLPTPPPIPADLIKSLKLEKQ